MSGAEGIAGLTFTGLSVAALFSTCLDCFDIVIKARDFEPDYQVLCADLGLQRLRFCLWAESVGLASRDSTEQPIHHPGLDDPIVKPAVAQALQATQLLLKQTDVGRARLDAEMNPSRGLRLFKDTFTRFRRGQQPLRKATLWAIHAGDKFQQKIERLKSLIGGLESVTKSLGVSDIQHSRMRDEIDSLDNIDDLRMIEVVSQHSLPDVSDTASRRITMIQDRSTIRTGADTYAGTSSTDQTFYTAEETTNGTVVAVDSMREFGEDEPEQYGPAQHQRVLSHLNPRTAKLSQWKAGHKTEGYGSRIETFDMAKLVATKAFPDNLTYLASAMSDGADTQAKPSLTTFFAERQLLKEVYKVNGYARWISAAPILSSIHHVLAGMEGPPDTPYESGVFWLDVRYPSDYPQTPPSIYFLTHVYHPNIDCRGNICTDILAKNWSPAPDLAAVLISIASLLSEPFPDDPLVPEIAQVYCEDYELYCRNARLYTIKYASAEPGAELARSGI